MAILEEIAASILSFEKMHPIALEKLKIVETHNKLHKTIKGQVQSIRRKLICHQQRAIDRQNSLCYQDELRSSILKMMDGLPQKLKKAQAEGLNSVL